MKRRTLKSPTQKGDNTEMPEKPTSTDLEVIDTTARSVTEWTPSFVTTVKDALAMVAQKREFLAKVMVEGTHYGKIPGAGDKPVLLLPGAQTLSANMALHPVFGDASPSIEDWTGEMHHTLDGGPDDHYSPEPFLSYRRFCELRRQTGPAPDDYMVVARAEGSCNSWESKYRYRNAARTCPQCGKQGFLFKSKPPRKGFFCWSKPEAGKLGCGANFKEDDARILNQVVGRIKNPDVLDQANTVLKMADKRAYIAATLQATGCADLFTQDLEDQQGSEEIPEGEVPESTEKPAEKAPAASPTPTTTSVPSTSTPAATVATTTAVATAPAASPPAATPSTAPTPTPPTSAEPEELELPSPNGIEGLRQKAVKTAAEVHRIHAEAKYPGQQFTDHQLEVVGRRSIDKWLEREKRPVFAQAGEEDLRDLITAMEKTRQSAA
jgi:ferredoxin